MRVLFVFILWLAGAAGLLRAQVVQPPQTEPDYFITVWKTDNPSNTFGNTVSNSQQIKYGGVGSNFTIYWEDVNDATNKGVFENLNGQYTNAMMLTFPKAGTYRLKAAHGNGIFLGYSMTFGGGPDYYFDYAKLIRMEQWGTMEMLFLNSAFQWAANMEYTATDVPNISTGDLSYMFRSTPISGNDSFKNWDTSRASRMDGMFFDAVNFNADISTWNTANVTNMVNMFSGAKAFNQPIGNWNTSKVTNMGAMFKDASSFNQPIGNWDTGKVTNMGSMFSGATAFNQPINTYTSANGQVHWDVSQVTEFYWTFREAKAFNQDIGNWNTGNAKRMTLLFKDATAFNNGRAAGQIGPPIAWNTSKVTDMGGMFSGAWAFNQPLGNWDFTNTTTLTETTMNPSSGMFEDARVFNQPLSHWDIGNSKITSLNQMFSNARAFNQNINNWNTSKITKMERTFDYATAFNQPLDNWNTASVTDMNLMFSGAYVFNHPIGNWNTTNVTNMEGMFRHAKSFNQSLDRWDITKVSKLYLIFGYSNISAYNLTKTLQAWSTKNFTLTNPYSTYLHYAADEFIRHCLPEATVAVLASKNLLVGATRKCGTPGTIYAEVNNSGYDVRKTLVSVKENGAFEWLSEYYAPEGTSEPGGTENVIRLDSTFGGAVANTSLFNRAPAHWISFSETTQLHNSKALTGAVTEELLPSTTLINGENHAIGKIVYNPSTGNTYEATSSGWERVDN